VTDHAPEPEPEPAPAAWRRLVGAFRRYGRWLLLALGILAVVLLVCSAGAAEVGAAMRAALPYLPLIALCEALFVGMDAVSLALLHGEGRRRIPLSAWVRSSLLHYGVMVLLPAGRAGGEVTRAAVLSAYVAAPRAAAASVAQHGVSLLGTAVISVPCGVAVAAAMGPASLLSLAVAINGLATLLLALAVLFGPRLASVGGWLGRRVAVLAAHGTRFDDSFEALPALPFTSVVAVSSGRAFQTLQYGLIVAAMGASPTVSNGLVAQSIHLVGAGLGEMVPNQVGVTEGAFRLFGEVLGLSAAAAVAIALIRRAVQLGLAGLAFLLSALAGGGRAGPAGGAGGSRVPRSRGRGRRLRASAPLRDDRADEPHDDGGRAEDQRAEEGGDVEELEERRKERDARQHLGDGVEAVVHHHEDGKADEAAEGEEQEAPHLLPAAGEGDDEEQCAEVVDGRRQGLEHRLQRERDREEHEPDSEEQEADGVLGHGLLI
jgi:hypothetical protein